MNNIKKQTKEENGKLIKIELAQTFFSLCAATTHKNVISFSFSSQWLDLNHDESLCVHVHVESGAYLFEPSSLVASIEKMMHILKSGDMNENNLTSLGVAI
jgi:hypothetical protein